MVFKLGRHHKLVDSHRRCQHWCLETQFHLAFILVWHTKQLDRARANAETAVVQRCSPQLCHTLIKMFPSLFFRTVGLRFAHMIRIGFPLISL
jgi:hypothetical protein